MGVLSKKAAILIRCDEGACHAKLDGLKTR